MLRQSCFLLFGTVGLHLVTIHLLRDSFILKISPSLNSNFYWWEKKFIRYGVVSKFHATELTIPDTASTAVFAYSIVYHDHAFYTFGGSHDRTDSNVIARLDVETTTWTQIGSLNYPRRGHETIFDGSSFLVVGGITNSFRTEKCILSGGSMTCTDQEPTLTSYDHYPELLLVNEDFGKSIDTCLWRTSFLWIKTTKKSCFFTTKITFNSNKVPFQYSPEPVLTKSAQLKTNGQMDQPSRAGCETLIVKFPFFSGFQHSRGWRSKSLSPPTWIILLSERKKSIRVIFWVIGMDQNLRYLLKSTEQTIFRFWAFVDATKTWGSYYPSLVLSSCTRD